MGTWEQTLKELEVCVRECLWKTAESNNTRHHNEVTEIDKDKEGTGSRGGVLTPGD